MNDPLIDQITLALSSHADPVDATNMEQVYRDWLRRLLDRIAALERELAEARERVKCFEDAGGVAMSTRIFTEMRLHEEAEADRDIFMASNAGLTSEVLQLRDDIAALRQRHAEAVEQAFREGYVRGAEDANGVFWQQEASDDDAAWIKS